MTADRPAREGNECAGRSFTHKEMEALAGEKLGTKLQMLLLGEERLFHKVDDLWEEYPLPDSRAV